MRKASAIRRKESEHAQANIIADRLKLARAAQTPPLTMEETAKRASVLSGYHISRDMVIRIEKKRRSVYDYEVYALALALDVDVRYLMGLTEHPGTGERLPAPAAPMEATGS